MRADFSLPRFIPERPGATYITKRELLDRGLLDLACALAGIPVWESFEYLRLNLAMQVCLGLTTWPDPWSESAPRGKSPLVDADLFFLHTGIWI